MVLPPWVLRSDTLVYWYDGQDWWEDENTSGYGMKIMDPEKGDQLLDLFDAWPY